MMHDPLVQPLGTTGSILSSAGGHGSTSSTPALGAGMRQRRSCYAQPPRCSRSESGHRLHVSTAAGVSALLIRLGRHSRRRRCLLRKRALDVQVSEEVSRRIFSKKIRDSPDWYRPEFFVGKDIGLVATRDYTCGELVMSDKPVLTFQGDNPHWRDDVLDAFEGLPRTAKLQVKDLACVQLGDDKNQIGGILHANAYERGIDSRDGVLCLGISRFNHSCSPNLEQSWSEELGELQVRATRDIKAGEELCTYFVDVRASTDKRLSNIREVYGFECKCEACTNPDGASDKRRRRMQQLLENLQQNGAKDPAAGLEAIEELVALYKEEESFPNIYTKQAFYYAFQCALILKDVDSARAFVEEAARWSTLCHGESHTETQRLLRYARFPRSHQSFKTRQLFPYV